MRIKRVTVTPIAFKDPPLLNASGIHEPYALRSIIQVESDGGLVGLGESYGDAPVLSVLERVKDELIGLDPMDLNGLRARVKSVVAGSARQIRRKSTSIRSRTTYRRRRSIGTRWR